MNLENTLSSVISGFVDTYFGDYASNLSVLTSYTLIYPSESPVIRYFPS
jgi:hypothetical protein